MLALASCGRLDFDSLGAPADASVTADVAVDTASSSHATYAGVFAATRWSGPSASVAVAAHAAGNAVVLHTGCGNGTAVTPAVSAPGWTFTSLGPALFDGGQSAQMFVALAPDTMPTTLTITWSGSCNGGGVEADELANTDVTGGTTTFDAHAETMGTGTCSASLTTGHDNDAIWAACSSSMSLSGIDPAFTMGANDTGGDWAEYLLSSDPAGTLVTATFANSTNSFIIAIVSVKPR